MDITMNWQSLEKHIKELCQIMWQCPFQHDRIDGVNFDTVGRISEEEIIIVETTKEFSLEKVRGDVAKFSALKLRMAASHIILRAFIVLERTPTQGMLDIAKGSKVQILSVHDFINKAFDYTSYKAARNQATFGSSIDPITGLPDNNRYTPVNYFSDNEVKRFTINEICEQLKRKGKVILLGDYGTGKSRCVREAFSILSDSVMTISSYPLAINLREHWGAQTGIEIISGHFRRLGFQNSIDQVMRLLNAGKLILLLDGFDEVGTQTFGNIKERRETIRHGALSGVRDLIHMNKGGVLITGRPHYFDDNSELLKALGLDLRHHTTSLIKCRDEFDDEQANEYLATLGYNISSPKWLPKKPLVFQIIASMNQDDARKILNSDGVGEISFWGNFIDAVCHREASMHPSIEASTVRDVLANLARITRTGKFELGRLTPKDVNNAYEISTGHAPDESGHLMLSRLCTLGRIEPESPDRQFVDPYIIQLLFADCVIDDVSNKNYDELKENYLQALNKTGLLFLSLWLETYAHEDDARTFIHIQTNPKNSQLVGELVSALMMIDSAPLDFNYITLSSAEVFYLNLGARHISNLTIADGIIHNLDFGNCLVTESSNVQLKNLEIIKASGLSSSTAIPTWISDCRISLTDSVSNSSIIKSSQLPPSQKLFLSIVQKIFFQRGGGRKENSLYKGGFGQAYDRKIIEQILHILVSEGVIDKSKDTSGYIYNPRREYTAKMKAIKDQLSLSKDPLWLQIGELSK